MRSHLTTLSWAEMSMSLAKVWKGRMKASSTSRDAESCSRRSRNSNIVGEGSQSEDGDQVSVRMEDQQYLRRSV